MSQYMCSLFNALCLNRVFRWQALLLNTKHKYFARIACQMISNDAFFDKNDNNACKNLKDFSAEHFKQSGEIIRRNSDYNVEVFIRTAKFIFALIIQATPH